MTTITCDICGKKIEHPEWRGPAHEPIILASDNPVPKIIGLTGPLDVCARCNSIREDLDLGEIILSAWKSEVQRRASQDE